MKEIKLKELVEYDEMTRILVSSYRIMQAASQQVQKDEIDRLILEAFEAGTNAQLRILKLALGENKYNKMMADYNAADILLNFSEGIAMDAR